MTEPVLLDDLGVWLGGVDFSGSLNSINLSAAKAELGSGVFGNRAETMFPGLNQVRAQLGGFFNSEAGGPDPTLFPRIDPTLSPAAFPLTAAPPDAPNAVAGAEGNIAYTVVGREFAYNRGAPHGQLYPYDFVSLPASQYDLYRQRIDRAKTLVTATTTSTGAQLGALAGTQKMVAVLHVFAIDGGSWVLTVESDDNSGFTTPTTRITFGAVTTAPVSIVLTLDGAVADDYWRTVFTKAGGTSITYAALLGIARI